MICEERLAFEEYDRLPSIITCKTDLLFSSLFSSVLYKARVRCRTASGWSNWSIWVTGRTRPAPPDAPPPLEIVKVSVNGLFLKWDPPLRDNGFPIDHYLLEVADDQLVGFTATLDASLLDDRGEENRPMKLDTDCLICTNVGVCHQRVERANHID